MLFAGKMLDAVLKDLDGVDFKRQPIPGKDPQGSGLIPITLRYAVRLALTAESENPKDVTPLENKMEYYELAKRIYNHPSVNNIELSAAEIDLIEKKVKVAWPIELSGNVQDILNGRIPFPPQVDYPESKVSSS